MKIWLIDRVGVLQTIFFDNQNWAFASFQSACTLCCKWSTLGRVRIVYITTRNVRFESKQGRNKQSFAKLRRRTLRVRQQSADRRRTRLKNFGATFYYHFLFFVLCIIIFCFI